MKLEVRPLDRTHLLFVRVNPFGGSSYNYRLDLLVEDRVYQLCLLDNEATVRVEKFTDKSGGWYVRVFQTAGEPHIVTNLVQVPNGQEIRVLSSGKDEEGETFIGSPLRGRDN